MDGYEPMKVSMKMQYSLVLLVIILLCSSCSPGPNPISMIAMPVENEFSAPCAKSVGPQFDISLCPQWEKPSDFIPGYRGFRLTIKNKTLKPIEVVWNKTYYINSGQTYGGFMFDGVVYKDRNNLKPNDMVLPSSEFSKTIFPNNFVSFNSGYKGRYAGWVHMTLPQQEQGGYITILVDGKEAGTKLLTDITKKALAVR